jgi:signal transduction histidine kinase
MAETAKTTSIRPRDVMKPGPDMTSVFTFVWRIGLVVSLATFLLLASTGTETVRLVIIGAVPLVLATAMRLGTAKIYLRHPRTALAFAFAAQGVIVCATGGLESPFVFILLPLAVVVGLLTERWADALSVLLAPVLLVIALAWLQHAGLSRALLPDVLERGVPYRAGETGLGEPLFALMLMVVLVGSGALGAQVRVALDASYARASRLERELAETLADRNREILGLSSALAHELKNPLTAIQGLATLLARRPAESDREVQQVRVLVSEIKRMGAVVDDFLGFSRPLSDLSLAPTDLGELAREIALLHDPVAAERGVRIVVVDEGEALVTCDPRKVKQVVVNLLQNALDAAPEATTITVELRARERGATMWIDDEGPGLGAAMSARLFTPGATSKPEGSGLGLTIARTLAEQHGGTLSLENRPTGGCRAALTLLRQPPLPEGEVSA